MSRSIWPRCLIDAGARVLQLRLKDACGRDFLAAAREIAALCRKADAILLVNDRVDIAMLSGAAGVHLGQTDIPLRAARKLMGPGAIIGISTASIDQARAADAGGADYIGFGPMYPGGAKHNASGKGLAILREVRAAVGVPIVAIGGITEQADPRSPRRRRRRRRHHQRRGVRAGYHGEGKAAACAGRRGLIGRPRFALQRGWIKPENFSYAQKGPVT